MKRSRAESVDLFASSGPRRANLPVTDGASVRVIERWMEHGEALFALSELIHNTPWNHAPVVMAGREVMQPRLTASYGDLGLRYRYSGTINVAHHWTPTLLRIRDLVAKEINQSPNFVLLNMYRDGNDSIGWHSDDERDLGENPTICSLSLGCTRRFMFKHKRNGQYISNDLQSGTLMIMSGATQQHYAHHIPKEPGAGARVSLTFRKIIH